MTNPYDFVHGHEGQILTYPQLCDLLQIEMKSGKARYLQFDDLEQYIKLDRETIPKKIVIQEIYKPDNFKITRKRGKTLPFIENTLLSMLKQKAPLRKTYRELFQDFGMGNRDYLNIKYHPYDELSYMSLTIQEKFQFEVNPTYILKEGLLHFERISWTIIKDILRSSLRQLSSEKKGLITIQKSLRLLKKEPYIIGGDTNYRMIAKSLSAEEHKEYIQLEKDVLEKSGYPHLGKLYYSTGTNAELGRLYYEDSRDSFIKKLGYEKAATEYIIDITEKGQNTLVDSRFLASTLLQQEIGCKLYNSEDLHKIVPRPLLNNFVLRYFGYVPKLHNAS